MKKNPLRKVARKQKKRSYSILLKELRKSHPELHAALDHAHRNRETRLSSYQNGIRLKGIEELLVHLRKLHDAFERSNDLRPIAFLLFRAYADFQTALEASLSGFNSIAADSMRDVMEIEFLLREFYFEPDNIHKWLTCSEEERLNNFRPGVLRQKYANRVGKQPKDLMEAFDYKGHSISLHVSPGFNPFGGPGLIPPQLPFGDDAGFWEIFEHARRLVFAAHFIKRKLAPQIRGPANPNRELKQFRKGWLATRNMQEMALAIARFMYEEENKAVASESADAAEIPPTK